MRPGWNPARRNKNIGTKAQGHGSSNRLTIPESWHDAKRYYEKLGSFKLVTRTVGTRQIHFFVEPTKPGWFYPCSLDDICALLVHCPSEALQAFDFIVMRQPTHKQRILCPVWGRAIFSFDINQYSGSAIIIEAQDLGSIEWDISVNPERHRELARLRRDGHEIHKSRRVIEIRVTPDSLRTTVLYRTLLHEIGHHVDFSRFSAKEWDERNRAAKEDYAHLYAAKLYKRLLKENVLPFAPILDDQSFISDGLERVWFCPS